MQDIPFEITVNQEGQVQIVRGPQETQHEQFLEALSGQLPLGAAWEREYRSLVAMIDTQLEPLATAEDWQRVEVPQMRRLSGRWRPETGLEIDQTEVSADGQTWRELELPDAGQLIAGWGRHPLAKEPGELLDSFVVEHWQAGRIDFEPEPPIELLEVLEGIVEQNNGLGQSEWASRHWEQLGEPGGVPEAKRLTLELRRPSLLRHPGEQPLLSMNGFEVTLRAPAYSMDGDEWTFYEEAAPDAQEGGGLSAIEALLGNIFDEQTVTVTIWKNGKIEGELDELSAEQQTEVRGQLLQLTGAGGADWASFSTGVLRQVYSLPEDAELPVPEALRLDFPVDALRDPENPTSYYVESEVTFDGETWYDLYDDETLPLPLQ